MAPAVCSTCVRHVRVSIECAPLMLYAEHVSVYAWEVEGKGVPSPCVWVWVCVMVCKIRRSFSRTARFRYYEASQFAPPPLMAPREIYHEITTAHISQRAILILLFVGLPPPLLMPPRELTTSRIPLRDILDFWGVKSSYSFYSYMECTSSGFICRPERSACRYTDYSLTCVCVCVCHYDA